MAVADVGYETLTVEMQDVLAILSGVVTGLVLGMVGGGGSIIAVPLLLYLVGIPAAHTAIGTSAVAVSLSAFANLISYAREGLVKWPCAIAFALSGVLGTTVGSYAALQLPGAKLIALFGALMIGVGVLMLVRKNAEGDPDVRLTLKTAKSMLPWLIPAGLLVGTLSGFFGIGGGFLIVPALMFATGMPIRNAIATSLAAITAFGASTAASYAYAGQVDWQLAGYFVGGGIIGGIAGSYAGKALSAHKAVLQLVFALFVIATGVYVIHRAFA